MDTESIYKGMGEIDLGEKVIQLQDENKKLLEHVRKLEDDVERLCQEIIKMKKEKDALSRNISELFNTAKREIDRKNETINQLRQQLDDIHFRRNRAPHNSALENKQQFNKNNCYNESEREMLKDKIGHSKSPYHSEKEKTRSKTPVGQRSRSSSSSKTSHKKIHSKREYDKIRSPNRHRSRSRSPHRFKRRRSSSNSKDHGCRQKRSPFQRHRNRSREFHSKGHKREEHHSVNSINREKKQNIGDSNHRTDNREAKSHQEISNRRMKSTEKNSSKNKHYLLEEFEKLYNEDIDTEANPSPFSDREPFKCVPHDQNKNKDCKAHSVLTEIYKKTESLISEGNSSMVELTEKKDCDNNKNCLETLKNNKEVINEDPVKGSDPDSISKSECKSEKDNSSNIEMLKNTENRDSNSTSITPIQATQQNTSRRRRRCVLMIKD